MKKIPTNYTTVDWEIWLRIEGQVQKFCRKKWNGTWEDITSQTKIQFVEKLMQKEFTFRSDEDSKRYAYSIARRIARDVIDYKRIKREIHVEDVSEIQQSVQAETAKDERIQILLRDASPSVKQVIQAVLNGENIIRACRSAKISYVEFTRKARDAYCQLGFAW